MKNLIYSFLLILTCAPLGAQRVTPEVVATAGETFFNSTVILEWTLGEIMTETYTGNVVLTQGFHQPFREVPPPVARCREMVIAQIDADGNLDLEPADLDNGSSDENTAAADLNFRIDFGDNPLDCEDAGFPPQPAQPVTLVVTNAEGLTATCTSLVTVADTIPPVIICQDITLAIDETGNRIELFEFLDSIVVQAMDNCDFFQVFSGDTTSFSCAELGENSSVVFAEDRSFNTSSCEFVLTIIDPTFFCDDAPTAVCRETVTAQIDADGNLDLDPASLDNGSFDDNTAAADLLFSLDFGDLILDCDDVGYPAQPVNLVVTDNVGQTDTCTSLITVQDTIPPVLVCQDATVFIREGGTGGLSLESEEFLVQLTDNCEVRPLDIDIGIVFGCEDIGENDVSIRRSDIFGNESICTFVVTVVDTLFFCDEAPTAVCQEMVTAQIDADGNLDLDPASLDNGSFDDNTAAADLLFSLDFGGLVLDCDDVNDPAQPVSLVVTDNVGQTDICTSLVTVRDTIPPVLICHDVTVDVSLEVFDLAASGAIDGSRDNCTEFNALSSSFPIGCELVGDNELNIDVRDAYGNVASCEFILTITDASFLCVDVPPTVVCKPFTVGFDSFPAPTILLNANVFDDGSFDDGSIYTLVFSDATDRQENTTFDCSTTGFDQGQTFTAGQTGLIQSIKVRSGTAQNTELHLYNGNMANDPDVNPSTPDYSQDVELFFGQHSDQANLSIMTLDEPFPVVAGEEYTFVLDLESTLSRSCAGSAAYAAGQPISGFGLQDDPGGQDFTFEVNIIGPNEMEFPNVGGTLVTVFAVDNQGNVSDGCQTFINPDQALPVEWLHFSANAGAKVVDLHWETSAEQYNSGFHVERYATGQEWTAIAQVPARTGSDQGYDFTDNSPITGFSCYRIRQTDADGRISYSHIETLNFFPDEQVVLYPNPATDIINLQLHKGAELLGLLTISGRNTNTPFKGQDGYLQADISDLPAGVYFLRIRLADGTPFAQRLVVR